MNSRLTPELLQSFIRMIDAGNYKKVAAAYCKISEATFYEWQELGKQEQKDGVEIVRVLSDEMLPGFKMLGKNGDISPFPIIDGKFHVNWEQGMYRDFVESLSKAQAKHEARLLKIVDDAARSGAVTAAQWELQHRYPKRWTNRSSHEFSEPKGAPIDVRRSDSWTVEQLAAIDKILAAK